MTKDLDLESLRAVKVPLWHIARAWWPWVRRLRDVNGIVKSRWFWTPITYRFGHGGWVNLRPSWLWRFRHGVR